MLKVVDMVRLLLYRGRRAVGVPVHDPEIACFTPLRLIRKLPAANRDAQQTATPSRALQRMSRPQSKSCAVVQESRELQALLQCQAHEIFRHVSLLLQSTNLNAN